MVSKKQLGLALIEEGQLSEYHQSVGNFYMYDYHNTRYRMLKAQYRSMK